MWIIRRPMTLDIKNPRSPKFWRQKGGKVWLYLNMTQKGGLRFNLYVQDFNQKLCVPLPRKAMLKLLLEAEEIRKSGNHPTLLEFNQDPSVIKFIKHIQKKNLETKEKRNLALRELYKKNRKV